jgi:3-phenylpropionate/trans-cinnamate dioxygenase ferredoxin component
MTPVVDICPVSELPPGSSRKVEAEDFEIAIVNCGGEIFAIEDRCSHDDGILLDGPLDTERCTVECPRHGSVFDLRTGRPLNLPAYEPVETFPVVVDGDMIKIEVD